MQLPGLTSPQKQYCVLLELSEMLSLTTVNSSVQNLYFSTPLQDWKMNQPRCGFLALEGRQGSGLLLPPGPPNRSES